MARDKITYIRANDLNVIRNLPMQIFKLRTPITIDKVLILLSLGLGLPIARWAVNDPLVFLHWMNWLTLVSGGITLVLLTTALVLRSRLARSRQQYAMSFDQAVRLHGLRFFLWFMGHNGIWLTLGGLLVITLITFGGIYPWTLAVSISSVVAMLYVLGGLVYSVFFIFDRRVRALGVCWLYPVTVSLHDWGQIGASFRLQNRFEQVANLDLQRTDSVLRRLIAVLDLAKEAGADRPIRLLESNIYAAAKQELQVRGTPFAGVVAGSVLLMISVLTIGLISPTRVPAPTMTLALRSATTPTTSQATKPVNATAITSPSPKATPSASREVVKTPQTSSPSRSSTDAPTGRGTPMPTSIASTANAPSPVSSPVAKPGGTLSPNSQPTQEPLSPTKTPSSSNAAPQNNETPSPDHQPTSSLASTAEAKGASSSTDQSATAATASDSKAPEAGQTPNPNSQPASSPAPATAGSGNTPTAAASTGVTPSSSAEAAENAQTPSPNGQPTSASGPTADNANRTALATPSPAATSASGSAGTASAQTPDPNSQPTGTAESTNGGASSTAQATLSPGATPAGDNTGQQNATPPNPNGQPTSSAEPANNGQGGTPTAASSPGATSAGGSADTKKVETPDPNSQPTSSSKSSNSGAGNTPSAAPSPGMTSESGSPDTKNAETPNPSGQPTAAAAPANGGVGGATQATPPPSTPAGSGVGSTETPGPNKQAAGAAGTATGGAGGAPPAAASPVGTPQPTNATGGGPGNQPDGNQGTVDIHGRFTPQVTPLTGVKNNNQKPNDAEKIERPAVGAVSQIPTPPADTSQMLSIDVPPMTQLYGMESTPVAPMGNGTPVTGATAASTPVEPEKTPQAEERSGPQQHLPNWILFVFQPKSANP